jgi:hypothetical protein
MIPVNARSAAVCWAPARGRLSEVLSAAVAVLRLAQQSAGPQVP